MRAEFHWFWPRRLEDLLDNRITFGAISGEFEAGIILLGFGLWLRAAAL